MAVMWYVCVCVHAGVCVVHLCIGDTHLFMDVWRRGVGVGCLHLPFFALFLETVSLIKLGLTDWLDWSAC